MAWLRKLLGREEAVHAPPPLPEADHTALEAAKDEHRRILTRADKAIQDAMAHADKVFGPVPYRGPERRAKPR